MARDPAKRLSGRGIVAQIHLWVGLVLSLPLVALGLSGSLLVFGEEWASLLDPPPARGSAAAGAPHPLADVIAAARQAAPPGFAPGFYVAPAAPGGLASVRLMPTARERRGPAARIDVDPVSLKTYADRPASRLLATIHSLHANLFLPERKLVGVLGLAMLALGASGLVNWWPRPGRIRAAFLIRRKARGAALFRELHGAVGIWALLVFLLVSLSGVYLAFPETVREGVALLLPARDLRAAATTVKVTPVPGATARTPDEALRLAEAAAPGLRLAFLGLPLRPDQPYRLALLAPRQERGGPTLTLFIDPWTGEIVRRLDPHDFTPAETALAWQHGIHAGEGLGPLWKLLVFLAGLLPLLFAVTGVSLWWLKRRLRQAASRQPLESAAQPASARRAAE